MVYVTECAECRNRLPKLDGWRSCCKAFPNGKPLNFDYRDLKKRKVCNPDNGIGFEPVLPNKSKG